MKIAWKKLGRLAASAIAAAMVGACPLPFDYNGPSGSSAHTSDPSTPNITAPVTVSYSEQAGTSGTLVNNGTFYSDKTTTVTLSTDTGNAVIYYASGGSPLANLGSATKISGSSGQITLTLTASLQSLDIYAVAVGPNMLPSPAVHATVQVSPYPVFTVKYNGNGNLSGTVPTDGTSYVSGATVTVAYPGTLAKSGFTFGGWNTAANGSGTSHTAGSTMTMGSANVILYAMWNPIPTYSVAYNGNGSDGGTVPFDGNSYHAGDTVTVAAPGTMTLSTGFFVGWSSSAGTFSAGNTFVIGSANVTLSAMWVTVASGVITAVPANVTNVVIPEGVTGFGTVFRSLANLTSVTIPSTITSITVQAFLGCNQLTTITSNNARYKVINGALVDTVNGVLMLVPAKLSGPFSIPSVTSIDPYAFGSCANLTSVTIPASLTTISMNAFSGLQSPISITVPVSVTAIVNYAFYNCSVTNVIMQSSTPPSLGGTAAFSSPFPTIHVPNPADVATYSGAANWSAFAAYITSP